MSFAVASLSKHVQYDVWCTRHISHRCKVSRS